MVVEVKFTTWASDGFSDILPLRACERTSPPKFLVIEKPVAAQQ
jgi:hypothetical protein